ncbi:MAG: hybrid sensor histidine kinase/response regulator [Prosthecobacter sp.]|nr:hybrid sensor histidine kinase/response regulator [Prosthecobacter sp.]
MPTPASHPLNILLVEDHKDTNRLVRMSLERRGHTVTTAASVAEARSAFPAANANVLISDIGLPDGNGWELLREIRATSHVPAIAMSGYGCAEDLRRSQDAGFHAHLVKPFKVTELEAALRDIGDDLFQPTKEVRGKAEKPKDAKVA